LTKADAHLVIVNFAEKMRRTTMSNNDRATGFCARPFCKPAQETIDQLRAENERLKKELTITRDYIHHNNLEYDLMGYYGCSGTDGAKQ
jgi:hypothetical protein